jgi:5-methylcytosine-specific restriction endonuclease McrA
MSGLYAALPARPDFDESKYKLGSLCKRGHDWLGTDQTLRWINGSRCIECDRERSATRTEERKQRYQANIEEERRKSRERLAARLQDPEQRRIHNERTKGCNARRRATHGRESRSKNGLPYMFIEQHGFSRRHASLIAEMHAAGLEPDAIRESLWLRDSLLQKAGKLPSVARLVMNEQRRYWQVNPEAKAAHDRWWDKYKYSWRYKCDPLFRLHECQRNSEKKARNRGNHTVRISKKEIQARYAEFDHQCAFCGSDDRIVIEHVVPRSKGGPHALGNILPACHRCNTNKTNHEVETWYRRQPFFSELRWRKICRVLGWQRSSVGQLALL